MSCRRIKKSLLDYTSGSLPEDQAGSVEIHLERCESCSAMVEKLQFSGLALSSVASVPELSDVATTRMAAAIAAEAVKEEPVQPQPWPGFLGSARAIGAAAAVAALLIAGIIVVAVNTGNGPDVTRTTTQGASDGAASITVSKEAEAVPGTVSSSPESQDSGYRGIAAIPNPFMPKPAVKVTDTDYTQDTLRAEFENMPLRRQYATNATMGDALRLAPSYNDMVAEEFAKNGLDGAELSSMITYITKDEPTLLTCYVESAKYMSTDAWIIGLACPPRTGNSLNLSRVEIWVLDPVKYLENPDSSILVFIEHKL